MHGLRFRTLDLQQPLRNASGRANKAKSTCQRDVLQLRFRAELRSRLSSGDSSSPSRVSGGANFHFPATSKIYLINDQVLELKKDNIGTPRDGGHLSSSTKTRLHSCGTVVLDRPVHAQSRLSYCDTSTLGHIEKRPSELINAARMNRRFVPISRGAPSGEASPLA